MSVVYGASSLGPCWTKPAAPSHCQVRAAIFLPKKKGPMCFQPNKVVLGRRWLGGLAARAAFFFEKKGECASGPPGTDLFLGHFYGLGRSILGHSATAGSDGCFLGRRGPTSPPAGTKWAFGRSAVAAGSG